MIRLTKKLLFAIEAVLDIAYNGGHAPVRSSEIMCERCKGSRPRKIRSAIPQEVPSAIVLSVRSGSISSKR